MFSVAFEFDTEQEMQQVVNQLWPKQVTGELEIHPTSSGRFRLNIYSEKPIRDSVLDKLPGKRVQSKSSFGSSTPKETMNEND